MYFPPPAEWAYTLVTLQEGNRYAKMYNDPRLECVVSESIWYEGEVQFADLILPACTNFERWDISEFANCSGYIPDNYIQCNHRVISLQDKCIQPVGESKSDFHIYCELADRLGIGLLYMLEGLVELVVDDTVPFDAAGKAALAGHKFHLEQGVVLGLSAGVADAFGNGVQDGINISVHTGASIKNDNLFHGSLFPFPSARVSYLVCAGRREAGTACTGAL